MTTLTATRMMMLAQTEADAFGPDCLQKTIAGVPVTLEPGGFHGHVVVTDDRGTHHDFHSATWAKIRKSMEAYFGIVENGR
jgi:hypothetical protein